MTDISPHDQEPMMEDAAESAVPYVHIVLPVVGAIMMFLLATIAVTLA